MTDAASKPFRFLDLPIEVRNAIYHVILCEPPPAKLRRVEQADLLWLPEGMAVITHPSEMQILQTSRQVHAEAKDVMLRGNQFIRIRARGVGQVVKGFLLARQIPIIRTSALSRNTFQGFVMTHSIELKGGRPEDFPGPKHETDVDLVILHRDLSLFCEALAIRGTLMVRGFGNLTKHDLTIHNPFDSTLSPGFMSEKNQERLLQPYRHYLRGFSHFSVDGNVSASLAESVKEAVAEEHLPEPGEIIAEFKRNKDLGNRYFRQKEFHRAAEAYTTGYIKVALIRNGNLWPQITAKGGQGFLHAISETYYQVCLNCAQNILVFLRETSESNRTKIRYYCGKADYHVKSAMAAGDNFTTDWRPNLQQMAKLSFRAASIERVLGNMEAAKSLIDIARQQAPSDPVIRREAEEIEALLRSQAGLGRLLL
ncbi:hypothetical protein N8I77_000850 [Diaporthe amygdali]|uniref:Uncharacterized protein n=1 Tax=Phomopsis amygdali TaxID=1214568 RepID=A0AAD9SRN7_PHOAM|nr:uncharacterized protein J7T55_012771 [Diaporthe amygdali]KAJ0115491.1 hypothetical protein J7T55_012771 [Diaporthe amygdali]KAK2613985.1 hypothetical protein N8I77_000850 [Diaporthe amygdali]